MNDTTPPHKCPYCDYEHFAAQRDTLSELERIRDLEEKVYWIRIVLSEAKIRDPPALVEDDPPTDEDVDQCELAMFLTHLERLHEGLTTEIVIDSDENLNLSQQ